MGPALRGSTLTHLRALVTCAILASCGQAPREMAATTAATEVAEHVRIAECASARETCLLLNGVSGSEPGATLGPGSSFGRAPLTWQVSGRTSSATLERVLVLVDVSGSMKGDGIASVRPAVGSFLSTLREDGVEVAVVPFESHDVARRIRSATFGSPAYATRSLDLLPKPSGNTALYSAIDEGVQLLESGGQGKAMHLLVVTDGFNDVGAGDDRGLLSGAVGQEAVIRTASRSSVQIWTVGVGTSPRQAELAALAGSVDRSLVVATDPLAVSRALGRIGARFGANALLVGTSAPPALALGAAPRRVRAIIQSRDAEPKVVMGDWMPPLLAPPIASEIIGEPEVDSAARSALLTRTSGEGDAEAGGSDARPSRVGGSSWSLSWWRWALLFLPIGVVLLAAVPFVASVETAPPESSLVSAQFEPGGLRPGVREARPRSPEEITASRVERIVRVHSEP